MVITSTGKHFLKGKIVRESLVEVLPRPQPLPAGRVSGIEAWKAGRTCGENKNQRKEKEFWMDTWILALVAMAVALALLLRILL